MSNFKLKIIDFFPLFMLALAMGWVLESSQNWSQKYVNNRRINIQKQQIRYSTSKKVKINPSFVSGFTDAEGCFTISLVRKNKLKVRWEVKATFQIELHQKDKALLEQMKSYFGVGSISEYGSRQSNRFRVQSVKDLQVIIDHFENYPLITKKRADYELWKQAFYLVQNKEHLTMEGLEKIVAIKASMNKGLSPELKAAFPYITPMDRPLVKDSKIQDPNWLAGFTSGEGCFFIETKKSSAYKTGFQVSLIFQLTQHSRDITLMESLIKFWDCGNCEQPLNYNHVDFRIQKFSDITDKIIPFFNKYPIYGIKALDYVDFVKAVEIMKSKAHLTHDGLDEIRKIKAGMNKGRQ